MASFRLGLPSPRNASQECSNPGNALDTEEAVAILRLKVLIRLIPTRRCASLCRSRDLQAGCAAEAISRISP